MEHFNHLMKWPLGTLFYSFIGILIMFLIVVIINKSFGFSLKKEIIDDENVALWIMIGCFFIAIAIIIAAAII